mgnify:CR=1 FL=1
MTHVICGAALLLALLTIPILVLLRLTETKNQKARRLKHRGLTWKQVAQRLSVSPSTARRWALT